MRKPIFAFLITLLLFNSSSFVLAAVSTPLDQTEQKTVVASEATQEVLKNVTAIEVAGNKAISTNVIVSKMDAYRQRLSGEYY